MDEIFIVNWRSRFYEPLITQTERNWQILECSTTLNIEDVTFSYTVNVRHNVDIKGVHKIKNQDVNLPKLPVVVRKTVFKR